MSDRLRILVDERPLTGAWNMAVDEALLESALANGPPTLRWYRWSEPTLSLGYFQSSKHEPVEDRFSSLPRVRRLSGGGAILHHHEWTYSLTVAPLQALSANPGRLYARIHESVITVLNEFGIPARLRGVGDDSRNHHFLCFSRGDANDVVIGEHKVLGSAQRRRRGAVLQHGTLLLRSSEVAPELPGILDLAPGEIDQRLLLEELVTRTAAGLELERQSESGKAQNDRPSHGSTSRYAPDENQDPFGVLSFHEKSRAEALMREAR